MAFELSQQHLDMLNLMKAETIALLSTGDNSPHNDNIRRFDSILDIIAGIAGTIIKMQADKKASEAPVYAAPAPVVASVVEPVPAPPVAVTEVAPAPVVQAPAPTYNFGPG